MTSSSRFSSVAGSQTGHLGQPAACARVPPNKAGVSADEVSANDTVGNTAAEDASTPKPAREFFLMNSRLENEFVVIKIFFLLRNQGLFARIFHEKDGAHDY